MLGQLTLAKNKPITLRYINLKQLLFEAYYADKLHLILPFVCKLTLLLYY